MVKITSFMLRSPMQIPFFRYFNFHPKPADFPIEPRTSSAHNEKVIIAKIKQKSISLVTREY